MPHSLRAALSGMRHKQYITDEEYQKYIRTLDRYQADRDALEKIKANIPAVFTLPDNPTNGDVMKTIFPYAQIIEDLHSVGIMIKGNSNKIIWFEETWWNAPYRPEEISQTIHDIPDNSKQKEIAEAVFDLAKKCNCSVKDIRNVCMKVRGDTAETVALEILEIAKEKAENLF